MSQLTPQQRQLLTEADREGRTLVTVIDGRVAIILPPVADTQDAADRLARILTALDSAEEAQP